MLARSSLVLFAPILGGSLGSVPSAACCIVWYRALVYSNHPREAAASTYLAIIFGQNVSSVSWFLRSTAVPMQLPYQCSHCQCSVTTVQALMFAVVALKQPTIECLTLGLTWGMNGVTLSYCYPGDYPSRG